MDSLYLLLLFNWENLLEFQALDQSLLLAKVSRLKVSKVNVDIHDINNGALANSLGL